VHSDVVANTELGFPSAMDGGEAVKVALIVPCTAMDSDKSNVRARKVFAWEKWT